MCGCQQIFNPKLLISCALDARSSLAGNSKIFTNSPLVKKARENIMEFLLLNHPLDCPICDQAGECDLQDQSLFFGVVKKRFYNFKKIVIDQNIGPIIKTVMTRCIHCTRCVRFGVEICGTNDLGIFDRGIKTQIGTYINKIFQSELSGNLIDICPVGALTAKPYPFINRNWELKNVSSIDFSDGFGLDIQVLLKNNRIIKILPGYNVFDNMNNWISDKTRFLFEGIFFLARTSIQKINWNIIFKQFIFLIYFYDHLNRHFFKINPVIIVVGNICTLETINMLQILKKKFSFFQIRQTINLKVTNEFETSLQMNSATKYEILNKTNLCFLINSYPKYESCYLNLKLKKRSIEGNFKIIKFGSLVDSTINEIGLGNNLKTLKNIVEGNHKICQILKKAANLMIIVNSKTFNRKDGKIITDLINILKKNTTFENKNWNGYNLIHNSLNFTGINLLNNFKGLNLLDLCNSNLIYFINTNLNNNLFNKYTKLKLLNNLILKSQIKTIIDQNILNNNLFVQKTNLTFCNYLFLPSNIFFESKGNFINIEGILKKSNKLLACKKNTKSNWQIIRKLYSVLNVIMFVSNLINNKLISFNCNKLFNFKNLSNLLYLNTLTISNLTYCLFYVTNQLFSYKSINKFNNKKCSLNFTVLKKNVEDFYVNKSENYSKFSPTIVSCSKFLRLNNKNFV